MGFADTRLTTDFTGCYVPMLGTHNITQTGLTAIFTSRATNFAWCIRRIERGLKILLTPQHLQRVEAEAGSS